MSTFKVIGTFLGVALVLVFAFQTSGMKQEPLSKPEGEVSSLSYVIIQGNSLLAMTEPSFEQYNLNSREEIEEFVKHYYPELYDIVRCESSFRPKVCSYKGCEYGMGLGGIIPSTLHYCEEKLGRKLDPFDPKDNLDCCKWLLENEGLRHWNASRACWAKRSFSSKN